MFSLLENYYFILAIFFYDSTVDSRFKSRFFLISNTRKPLKKHNFLQNECLKQYKCLIALTFSNASDYICRYFHPLIRKIGKYGNIFFWNLKICCFFWNCSKIVRKYHFFSIFETFSFLNQTLGFRKSFLNQTTYVLKNRL